MKKIYEILKEFGLELPDDKKDDFEKAMKSRYHTKVEYDNVVAKRDEYKSSLDEVNEKLKAFDGVDVADLKGQITKLQADMAAKDAEYAKKESERQFNDTLDKAISEAGGKNAKAIRALLDVDQLMQSKDQTEDIKKALEATKKSDAYLFGSDEPVNHPVLPGGGGTADDDMSAIRMAMGLPAEKK